MFDDITGQGFGHHFQICPFQSTFVLSIITKRPVVRHKRLTHQTKPQYLYFDMQKKPDVSTFRICQNMKVLFMAFLWGHPVYLKSLNVNGFGYIPETSKKLIKP